MRVDRSERERMKIRDDIRLEDQKKESLLQPGDSQSVDT